MVSKGWQDLERPGKHTMVNSLPILRSAEDVGAPPCLNLERQPDGVARETEPRQNTDAFQVPDEEEQDWHDEGEDKDEIPGGCSTGFDLLQQGTVVDAALVVQTSEREPDDCLEVNGQDSLGDQGASEPSAVHAEDCSASCIPIHTQIGRAHV